MSLTHDFKKLMQLHGITYAELGRELGRSPSTVKQRLDTESTFHKHVDVYKKALSNCINKKEQEKEKAWKGLG